jgi:PAS domain S-box-containing protein
MKRGWVPFFSLFVGLMATLIATWLVANHFEIKARAEFNDAAQAASESIEKRVEASIALLRGCSGLFAVQRQVTAGQFRAFVDRLQVMEEYPGLQGIGYAARTTPGEQEALVSRMRAQGLAEFRIWPQADQPESFPILFLEPGDRRNRAAIGYDIFSDPVRRAAMEKARDTGAAVASGKLTLVQEIEGPRQAGFLIYVPVYREGDVPATLAERRASLQGFAYSPFRADDLLREIIDPGGREIFQLRVYDGDKLEQANLLHIAAGTGGPRREPRWQSTRTIDVAGRVWTLGFQSQAAFDARAQGGRIPLLIFFFGVLVSLLLFYFTNAEARARQTAEQAAARLKRSREALRQSEERMRLIVDSATDYGILTLDTGGAIMSWNTGAEQLFGYAANEIIGQNFKVLFPPEDIAKGVPQQELAKALETGRAEEDRWLLRKNGEKRFVSGICRAIRDDFGNVHGLIKVTRDITERREGEERLRNEKEFTDAIVQSLPGIFYVFDQKGKFIYWNRTLEQVTHCSGGEIAEMSIRNLIAEEQRELIQRRIEELFQRGQGTAEADLVRKDGSRVPYFFTGSRVELGGQICLVGMGVDITERRAGEHAIRDARDQLGQQARELERLVAERTANLEQSLASLEGILYHVAHDLRAPLRAMHGFTSILLKEYAAHFDATGEEYARRISEAAGRMDRLICDLLEYGQLAHMPLPLGRVPIEQPLHRVLGDLNSEIESKHAQLEITKPLPAVWANNTALEAILANLLSNALKFVRPKQLPRIRIRTHELDGVVRLCVEDNGIGIDPKYQDRVFRVFERLHKTDDYPGTGIGLAIVQKAAQRMNATVGVESVLGQGSTFWVDLPKPKPEQKQELAAANRPG